MRSNGITLSAARHGRRKLMTSPMRLRAEGVVTVDRRQGFPAAGPCLPFISRSCGDLRWPIRIKLAADSCGGNRGFGQIPHHAPLFRPVGTGTDDWMTIVFAESTAS